VLGLQDYYRDVYDTWSNQPDIKQPSATPSPPRPGERGHDHLRRDRKWTSASRPGAPSLRYRPSSPALRHELREHPELKWAFGYPMAIGMDDRDPTPPLFRSASAAGSRTTGFRTAASGGKRTATEGHAVTSAREKTGRGSCSGRGQHADQPSRPPRIAQEARRDPPSPARTAADAAPSTDQHRGSRHLAPRRKPRSTVFRRSLRKSFGQRILTGQATEHAPQARPRGADRARRKAHELA